MIWVRKAILYPRLAVTNLWKNRQTYLSFLFSTICTVFVFYTFMMISLNDGLKKLPSASNMQVLMALGAIVVALFSVIFLFYANSFLMKRRKKELGLYAILGLEKKHIARILFYEMTVLLAFSLLCGIGLGIVLSKLMFLLIQALMHIPTPIFFQISTLPVLVTVGLFVAVFFLLLLYNRLQVHLANPVNLLKGQQAGEKEPKTRWLLALIGVGTMGAGYIIANQVGNPLQALAMFFVAVILVIIGTYALFTAGSIAFLKMLRRNKGYYYQPRNFISVSGMIYRMKQNAAGLAGICILSTMAIITIGTTGALYVGQESMLRDQFPMEYMVSYEENEVDYAQVEAAVRDTAAETGVAIKEYYTGIYAEMSAYREGDRLRDYKHGEVSTGDQYDKIRSLYFIPLSEYNRMTGSAYTLGAGEALVFNAYVDTLPETLTIGETAVHIKEEFASIPFAHKQQTAYEPPMYLVVPDRETIVSLIKSMNGPDVEVFFSQGIWWNIEGADEKRLSFAETLRDRVQNVSTRSMDLLRRDWYAMYGGFLFLGVFLGLLFLMATTLIIYFKQVSEGYMDHDRFIILQKVGMSRDEVRKTVKKQILSVFILPIIAAVLHTMGALHMMSQLLALFGLGDMPLIAGSIFGTAAVFALLYGGVYMATAKTYYKMVRMNG